MSRHFKNITKILRSGLTSKEETVIRQELLSLYDSLQNELKSYPSSEYTNLGDYLTRVIPSLHESNTIINHKRLLYVTMCITCCGGILFNDMKSILIEHLVKLLDSASDELSELIALANAHMEATQLADQSHREKGIMCKIMKNVENEPSDVKTIIGLNTLSEIAARCPNHVFPNLKSCLTAVVAQVLSPKLKIRYAASICLRSTLYAVNYRETLSDRGGMSNLSDIYAAIYDKISKDDLLTCFRVSKQLLRDDAAHGRLLLLTELYKAAVICQNPEMVKNLDSGGVQLEPSDSDHSFFAMIEYNRNNRSYSDDVQTCTFAELHAMRLRRISGTLLSQTMSPVTMLEPYPPLVFRAPFGPRDTLISLRADIWTSVCVLLKTYLKNAFRLATPQPLVFAALDLLPWLAALYSRNDPLVTGTVFSNVVDLLLAGLKKEKYLCRCLYTLVSLTSVIPNEMASYIDQIFAIIHSDILTTDMIFFGRNKSSSSSHRIYPLESVQANVCFAFHLIAYTFKLQYENELRSAYELLVKSGLSVALTECTLAIITHVPSLRTHCMTVLYNYLSFLMKDVGHIAGPHFTSKANNLNESDSQSRLSRSISINQSSTSSTSQKLSQHFYTFGTLYSSPIGTSVTSFNVNTILIALRTIENFSFKGYNMGQILRIINDRLLQSDHKFVRMQSIRACCRMLGPLVKKNESRIHDSEFNAVSDYLQSIIKLSVSDSEADVRYLAISSLDDNPKFNYHIAKAENLSILFFATNDEVSEIREVAISLLGQLSNINPDHVLPSIRKILFELLHELYVGELYFTREQTLRSVGNLISSAPWLMYPYIHPIIQILMRVISENFNSPILVPAVHAIGEFAQVSAGEMKQYVDAIFFPILVEMLGPDNTTERKEVALWTMTRVVQSSAYVGKVGHRYPALFETLSNLIRSESSRFIHREALRVLGVLGALSPYKFKLYSGQISNRIESFPEQSQPKPTNCNNQQEIANTATQNRTYLNISLHSPGNFSLRVCGEPLYASHALSELLIILGNSQLKYVHLAATRALTKILSGMGPDASPYIYIAIVHVLDIMQGANEESLESLIVHLMEILQHMQRDAEPCLDRIFNVSCEVLQNHDWCANPKLLRTLLELIECLASVFTAEFRLYAIRLLPILRRILHFEPTVGNRDSIQNVLQLFSRIGYLFEQHMHVVIPAIVEVAADQKIDPDVRCTAIESLSQISRSINISSFASGIILPLTRTCASDPSLSDATLDCIIEIAADLGPRIKIYSHELYAKFGNLPTLDSLMLDSCFSQRTQSAVSTSGGDEVVIRKREDTTSLKDGKKDTDTSSPRLDSTYYCSIDRNQKVMMMSTNEYVHVDLEQLWSPDTPIVKEEIHDWFRMFTSRLLEETLSPSLKTCYTFLFNTYSDISRKLFNVSFMAYWTRLNPLQRNKMRQKLNFVLENSEGTDVAAYILELAEFFDHSDAIKKIVRSERLETMRRVSYRAYTARACPRNSRSSRASILSTSRREFSDSTTDYQDSLPVDLQLVSSKAMVLRMFAKALRYTEIRFALDQSEEVVENLISINNQLGQSEAAYGAVSYAKKQHMSIKELWYEKLNEWDRALRDYQYLQTNDPEDEQLLLGRMRCLHALGEWQQLEELCEEKLHSDKLSVSAKQSVAEIGSSCAWRLDSLRYMRSFIKALPSNTVSACMYQAMALLREARFRDAYSIINDAWDLLYQRFLSVASDDYRRNYESVFDAQMLVEFEEVIQYAFMEDSAPLIRSLWSRRLTECCAPDYEDWHRLLIIHSLVVPPAQDQYLWLKLADICTKTNKQNQARHIFDRLLEKQPQSLTDIPFNRPFAAYSYLKNAWHSAKGTRKEAILVEMKRLYEYLSGRVSESSRVDRSAKTESPGIPSNQKLFSLCCRKYGSWIIEIHGLSDEIIKTAHSLFQKSVNNDKFSFKAHTVMASFSYDTVLHYRQVLRNTEHSEQEKVEKQLVEHANEAVHHFVASVCLSSENQFQDLLRLLTIWFKFGHYEELARIVTKQVVEIPHSAWLQVIPQLIARIDSKKEHVRTTVQKLLIEVGKNHPQALIYPLAVTSKSNMKSRSFAANKVLNSMREHSNRLVQQALLVSEELIRISVLWQEQWHEALDEAIRQLNESVHGFFAVLEPLHKLLDQGPQTKKEKTFMDLYGNDLNKARDLFNADNLD